MEARKLTCKSRADRGKNAAGRLRRAGFVPGNVIHKGKSVPISIPETEFTRLLSAGLRSSSIIALDMEGAAKSSVVVKEVQRHPVSGQVVHIDFYELTPGELVRVAIPIEATGNSIGVKDGGALEQYLRTIPIRAEVSTIQEVVKVDITNLAIGDSVHVKDLTLPAGWEVMLEGNPIVLIVARSRMVVEEQRPAGAADAGAAGAAAAPAAAATAEKK